MYYRRGNYRFGRNGNVIPYREQIKSRKAGFSDYFRHMRDKRQKMLETGYSDNQTWIALGKCWMGYVIAKREDDIDKMRYYAAGIQRMQRELYDAGIIGIDGISDFPNLNMSRWGEKGDNASHLNNEYDLTDAEDPDHQHKKWLAEVYNADGLDRVLL